MEAYHVGELGRLLINNSGAYNIGVYHISVYV